MTHQNAVHTAIADLDTRSPIEGVVARRLMGEKVMVQDLDVAKGAAAPMHHHPNEQIMILLSGRFRMTVHDADVETPRTFVIEAGEVVHLPSMCPHGGEALEDCRIIDVFSPPSETTGIDKG